MDPDKCLDNCRAIVEEITRYTEAPDINTTTVVEELAGELAENFRSLDDWVAKGGFLPRVWRSR